MPYFNPPMPWKQLEGILSGRQLPDGGDGPAWSRKRDAYQPTSRPLTTPEDEHVPYAELHCHSNFSFLDGASGPNALVEEAVRLGLSALALTDHDGLYGVVRMAEAADAYGLRTVFGAELSLELPGPQNGVADPVGQHLLVLARGEEGYHRLAGALTEAHLAGEEKGKPLYYLDQLAEQADGHWTILTGCRKGAVRQALPDPKRMSDEIDLLVTRFGADRVVVELIDHGNPTDTHHNDLLAGLAAEWSLPTVATNNVHFATPPERHLAAAIAAVRARRGLDELDGWLPATGLAHLRSGAEMAARFARYPGAVARSVEIADDCAFALRTASPRLPKQDVPPGHTPMSRLRELVWKGAAKVYPDTVEVRERLNRELEVIEDKDFPGYFLIVHDLVSFARERGILCQGRGSAANSAVCYALEITAVDSIRYGLPFERFLSTTRDEEPDIDVDFDSDRREEVIQYVYQKYGRRNAAQVANVITYRPKSAVRDMAKALGFSTGQQDAWSKLVDGWATNVTDPEIPIPVLELAQQLLNAPRHLGIHSGGMVLTDRPVGEVCPIEPARMDQRTVLQWDKDDCAWMGLVKFDLLGLGMLGAIAQTLDLAAAWLGEQWTLASIPKDEPGVYDMLCRADSIGVFQVESRAQIGTLPRLKPRSFYDLVCEIALIRPGPIQGNSVHPFIRRRTGKEPITYPHPVLEPVLKRTLGVPLFQEQLMQMAVICGLSADDADLLRRAMGSKRGIEKIGALRDKLFAGMTAHGLSPAEADLIYAKIEAFAHFGFAESHSISFALLVYASTWLRLHYPGAFLAALLRSQPMGFYSPQTLVADARRHGVEVLRPDIQLSAAQADLEPLGEGTAGFSSGDPACLATVQPTVGEFDRLDGFDSSTHRRDAGFAVRLGLSSVTGVGDPLAEAIVAARPAAGYMDMADLARRVRMTTAALEALATAGAFECFGLSVRQALWAAGQVAQESPETLRGAVMHPPPPTLPGMSDLEITMADLWATSISPDSHPIDHLRPYLDGVGALPISQLSTAEPGTRVRVGGVVTHRQRPATAGGITFLNLEDETGLVNIVCTQGLWNRFRRVARNSAALVVRGILECTDDGVINVQADQVERLRLDAKVTSRDFR